MSNTEKAAAEENHRLVFETALTRLTLIFLSIFLVRKKRKGPTFKSFLSLYLFVEKNEGAQLWKLFFIYWRGKKPIENRPTLVA